MNSVHILKVHILIFWKCTRPIRDKRNFKNNTTKQYKTKQKVVAMLFFSFPESCVSEISAWRAWSKPRWRENVLWSFFPSPVGAPGAAGSAATTAARPEWLHLVFARHWLTQRIGSWQSWPLRVQFLSEGQKRMSFLWLQWMWVKSDIRRVFWNSHNGCQRRHKI